MSWQMCDTLFWIICMLLPVVWFSVVWCFIAAEDHLMCQ